MNNFADTNPGKPFVTSFFTNQIQARVRNGFQRLHTLLTTLTEPSARLTDPRQRQHIRLLNSLLLLFATVNIGVFITRLILTPQTLHITVVNVGATLIVLAVVYGLGQRGHYDLTFKAILILGIGLLLNNAYRSTPPHFEIAYLIFVPFFSTILYRLRTTVYLSGFILMLILLYIQFTPTMEREAAIDIMTFTMLMLIFTLMINYQRSLLEHSRQQMALDKERSDMLTQILSYMSHDLKTPLTVINTSLYLLKHTRTPPERHPQLIKQIEDQSARLQKSIQDILTMSRLDHVMELTQEKVDLNRLINHTAEQFMDTAHEKEVMIWVELDSTLPLIVANKDALERLMSNLIENAVNYSNAGSLISVTTRRDTGHVQIEVKDMGIGIDAHDLPHIFEHFYRADAARSTHTGGSGLGLAIVKKAVDIHGGAISVQSKPGIGTTFHITLPTLV